MEFSKVADSSFTWIINDFQKSTEKTFISRNFTTSIEPNRQWHLVISVIERLGEHCERCERCSDYEHKLKSRLDSLNTTTTTTRTETTRMRPKKFNFSEPCNPKISRKMIDLKFICDKAIIDPLNMKINVSIINDVLIETYTRSFIVTGNNKIFGFDNFIDYEELLKMTNDGELKVLAETFLQNEEKSDGLKVFLNSEFLSDIQISIEEYKFHAHKVILAEKSPYFYGMFQENKEINEINNIHNVKPDAFMEILKYIYTDVIDKWSLSCDILLGANVLQMDNLKLKCEEYLRNNLTVHCVCPVLMLAVECNTKCLLKHCLYYVLKHINLIGKSGLFQCLKTEPVVILSILNEIFYQTAKNRVTIFNNIKDYYQKSTMKTCCQLLHDYEPFLNNNTLSDITIHVGDKIYQCHKLVLVANSPVLQRMLSSNMKEALNNLIEINDMSPEVFLEVLRYMYTGKVENLEEYGIEILKAADKYNLDQLKVICEESLDNGLTLDNVVNIVKIANTYNASFLKRRCVQFIVKNLVYYSRKEKTTKIISLESFLENHSIILYEILILLSMQCDIDYD